MSGYVNRYMYVISSKHDPDLPEGFEQDLEPVVWGNLWSPYKNPLTAVKNRDSKSHILSPIVVHSQIGSRQIHFL
jgi:hypothetical protein